MALKEETKTYYDRLRNKGIALIKFNCPYCDAVLETEKNNTLRTWDTLSTCPECEKGFMKITLCSGGDVIANTFKK